MIEGRPATWRSLIEAVESKLGHHSPYKSIKINAAIKRLSAALPEIWCAADLRQQVFAQLLYLLQPDFAL